MSNRVKYVYSLFLTLLFYLTILSQENQLKNFTTSNGLPSDECYSLLKDRNGYMWVSTLNGLCKYNGKQFQLFTIYNGLPGNAIYALHQDNLGRVWFACSNNAIGYIQNDSVFTSTAAFTKVADTFKKQGLNIYNIISDDSTNIYLISNELTVKLLAKQQYKYSAVLDYRNTQNYFSIKQLNNGLYFPIHSEIKNRSYFSKQETLSFDIEGNSYTYNYLIKNIKYRLSKKMFIEKDNTGHIYLNTNNYFIQIAKNKSLKIIDVKLPINYIYISPQNDLYVSTLNKGLLKYSNCNIEKRPDTLLKNKSVSQVIVDFENNLWVNTLEYGVYFISNQSKIINYQTNSHLNSRPNSLKIINNKVYTINFDGAITVIDPYKNTFNSITINKNKDNRIREFIKIDENFIGLGVNKAIKCNNKYTYLSAYNSYSNSFKFSDKLFCCGIIKYNDRVFAINRRFLGEIVNTTFYEKHGIDGYCKSVQGFNNKIFVCSNTGLYYMDLKQQGKINSLIENVDFIQLLLYADKLIAIDKNSAIYIIEKDNTFKKIDISNHFTINDVCIIDSNHIWIASNNGVWKAKLNFVTAQIQLKSINTIIDSKEIFKICALDSFVFFGTKEGVYKMIDSRTIYNTHPMLNLKHIKINDSLCNMRNISQLEHNQNNLSFAFDAIGYSAQTKIVYKTTLNQKFKTVDDDKITFNNLNPGNYQLEVFALNANGFRSPSIIILFSIRQAYYSTWWFLAIVFTIFGAFIYLITFLSIRKKKRKELEVYRINQVINEYKLMGLKTQMNPHFLFNSLNSIQNYIQSKKFEEAYQYLDKFSIMIRKVLMQSNKSMVTLNEELDLIEKYIEIEKMRFGDTFNFELKINENVDPYYVTLPSMIIQPYVENAIWHGLMKMNDTEKKELLIQIELVDAFIVIDIIDNGQGIMKKTNGKHVSISGTINEKRIEAINAILNTKSASIKTLSSSDGTKVTIKIPI